jgi:hypothetical protein
MEHPGLFGSKALRTGKTCIKAKGAVRLVDLVAQVDGRRLARQIVTLESPRMAPIRAVNLMRRTRLLGRSNQKTAARR